MINVKFPGNEKIWQLLALGILGRLHARSGLKKMQCTLARGDYRCRWTVDANFISSTLPVALAPKVTNAR